MGNILQKQTFDFVYDEINQRNVYKSAETLVTLVVGRVYAVKWDNIEYICIATEIDGFPTIGNASFFGETDTGEPFFISMMLDVGTIMYASEASSHTLEISLAKVEVFPEQTVTIAASDNGKNTAIVDLTGASLNILPNTPLIVTWDGTEYRDVLLQMEESAYTIGNLNMAGLDTGIEMTTPFVIVINLAEATVQIITTDSGDTHTISLHTAASANIPETIMQFEEQDGMYIGWDVYIGKNIGIPTVGESCKVTWDGVAYESKCIGVGGIPALGNLYPLGLSKVDTGEPYVMMWDLTGDPIMRVLSINDSEPTSHTFAILPVSENDKNYLIPEKSIAFAPYEDMEGMYASELDLSSIAASARLYHTYTVVWDGVEYNEMLYYLSDHGAVTVGNLSYVPGSTLEDSGVPFLFGIIASTGMGYILTKDASETHTIAVYKPEPALIPYELHNFALDNTSGVYLSAGNVFGTNWILPIIGETYDVIWDRTVYQCEAKPFLNTQGYVMLGNLSLFSTSLENTNEPFLIGFSLHVEGQYSFITESTAATHKLGIYPLNEAEVPPVLIVLYDKKGNPVEYENVETLSTDTNIEGGRETFTRGTLLDGVEVDVDFSGGNQKVTVPSGRLIKEAIIRKPADLLPENILSGKNIAGIAGTHTDPTVYENVTLELDFSNGDQRVEMSEGNVLKSGTIKKPDNLIPENLAKDINVAGIIGTLEVGGSFSDDEIAMAALIKINAKTAPYIAPYAFYSYPNLLDINFPVCETIGEYAFYNCVKLSDIIFPKCKSIGANAFSGCNNIKNIDFSSCVDIPSSAFSNLTNLISAKFPVCEKIGDSVFCDCAMLSDISFPMCTTIGDYAFSGTNLSDVKFSACTQIGVRAFENCTKLSAINFPVCSSISGYAFMGCINLLNADFPLCNTISTGAFKSCTNLISANFPNCKVIPEQLFSDCYSLANIRFPLCTTISTSAFYNCTALSIVSFPKCSLVYGAFSNCRNLLSVDLPICKTLSIAAFRSCAKLINISIPACVSINNAAFMDCTSLSTIDLPVCTKISLGAFSNCKKLSNISVPVCGIIGSNAFNGCINLSTISLPKCNKISQSAFYGCSNLMSLYLMGSSLCALSYNALANTPLSNSTYTGTFGSVYVPSSLLASYIVANYWSEYSSRFVGI